MPMDYKKLKGKIIEVLGSQKAFAKAMGLSERTVSLKMNGLIEWNQDEMLKAIRILGLFVSDITEYFFTLRETSETTEPENSGVDVDLIQTLSEPIIRYIKDNHHPYTAVTITGDRVVVTETVLSIPEDSED